MQPLHFYRLRKTQKSLHDYTFSTGLEKTNLPQLTFQKPAVSCLNHLIKRYYVWFWFKCSTVTVNQNKICLCLGGKKIPSDYWSTFYRGLSFSDSDNSHHHFVCLSSWIYLQLFLLRLICINSAFAFLIHLHLCASLHEQSLCTYLYTTEGQVLNTCKPGYLDTKTDMTLFVFWNHNLNHI